MTSETNKLSIAVFDGTTDDILQVDFSFLNLKVLKLDSTDFQTYLTEFVIDTSHTFYEDWLHNSSSGYRPNLYGFCPIDRENPVEQKLFEDIEAIMLIMFPSVFQLIGLVFYDRETDKMYRESYANQWDFVSHWNVKGGEDFDSELLQFGAAKLSEINAFIATYFEEKDTFKDFDVAVNSYLEGFSQRSPKMAYINFSIALEALIEAEFELSYRISRTCAVINADSKSEGWTIFNNTKNFYKLRSKIVHGDGRLNYFSDYFYGLRALVSRTLIEILTLQFSDRRALGTFVDESGFGDKLTSNNYNKNVFSEDVIRLLLYPVPNYKSPKK